MSIVCALVTNAQGNFALEIWRWAVFWGR